jgi:hypothetical protein
MKKTETYRDDKDQWTLPSHKDYQTILLGDNDYAYAVETGPVTVIEQGSGNTSTLKSFSEQVH